MKKISVKLLYTSVIVFVFMFFYTSTVVHTRASELCDETVSQSINNATVHVASRNYDTFVRINPAIEDTVKINIVSNDDSSCKVIGSESVSGNDGWVKVGSTTFISRLNNIYLSYNNEITDVKPEVVFVSDEMRCDPDSCKMEYDEKKYSIVPSKVSYTHDNLSVFSLTQPSVTSIESVRYYLGDSFVYKSENNLEIDTNRFPPGEHKVVQTIQFTDGVILYRSVDVVLETTLQQFLSPFYYKYKHIITYLIALAVLLIVTGVTRFLHNSIRRKLIWRKTHLPSNTKNKAKKEYSLEEKYKIAKRDSDIQSAKIYTKKIIILPLAVLICFYATVTWVVADIRIDGISMETTLQNRSRHVLLKLPSTISSIVNDVYVPKRGDTVMFVQENQVVIDDIQSEETHVVKRVIGLPSEKIKIVDNKAFLLEEDESVALDAGSSWESVVKESEIPYEMIIALQNDEIFVLGDNRVDSLDSRHYGPIKLDDIRGEVLYRHRQDLMPLR